MRLYGMGATALLLVAGLFANQQPESVIVGDYIEDRSNRVYGCYCEWSGENVTGGKEAILGWHIRQGDFRGTSIAGVTMAAVIVGEASLSARRAPRKSLLFIDSSASTTQRQAAEALLREKFGSLLGRIISVNPVPIEFHKEAENATLRIGDLVNLELRKANPPEDALIGAVLWYDPFIPMTESTLGMTINTSYQGSGFDQQWNLNEPGISGYYGTFQLASR